MSYAGRVTVFSITGCPFCQRVKKLLYDEHVPFIDVNLDKYPERRHEMQDRSGKRTVPQIFFNSTHIGGCDDLMKLVSLSLYMRLFMSLICTYVHRGVHTARAEPGVPGPLVLHSHTLSLS